MIDDDAEQPTPIVVSDSATPGQAGVTIRQAALLVTTWLSAKGYIDGSTSTLLIGVIPMIATLAWGQYRQWKNHREKRALAISAPIGTLK